MRAIVMRGSRIAVFALLGCLFAASASAQYRGEAGGPRRPPRPRTLAIGIAPTLALATGEVCQQELDVVSCGGHLFLGGDVAAHYFLLDMIALGGRVAGSVAGSSSESGESVSVRPEEQWLWRANASARLYPPFFRILFVSGEIGFALMHEVASASMVSAEESSDRATLLLGVAAGLDLHLGPHWVLAPEVRLQSLDFGDPHEYEPGVEGFAYDSSLWAEAAVRLTYEL